MKSMQEIRDKKISESFVAPEINNFSFSVISPGSSPQLNSKNIRDYET